ncbi:MAG: hypothetical protein QW491_13385 [Thermoproteota archaeon]
MNPQLRKRFIDSIEYLRRMDFFKDYSNLSSEEIFDRILSGEISYETHWFAEEWSKEERRKMKEEDIRKRPLEEMFEEREEHWMKASDFEFGLYSWGSSGPLVNANLIRVSKNPGTLESEHPNTHLM